MVKPAQQVEIDDNTNSLFDFGIRKPAPKMTSIIENIPRFSPSPVLLKLYLLLTYKEIGVLITMFSNMTTKIGIE